MPRGQFLFTKPKRDRRILLGIRAGWTNAHIARSMGYAEQTVKGYVSELFEQFGAKTRTELVMLAMYHGTIPRPDVPADA